MSNGRREYQLMDIIFFAREANLALIRFCYHCFNKPFYPKDHFKTTFRINLLSPTFIDTTEAEFLKFSLKMFIMWILIALICLNLS